MLHYPLSFRDLKHKRNVGQTFSVTFNVLRHLESQVICTTLPLPPSAEPSPTQLWKPQYQCQNKGGRSELGRAGAQRAESLTSGYVPKGCLEDTSYPPAPNASNRHEDTIHSSPMPPHPSGNPILGHMRGRLLFSATQGRSISCTEQGSMGPAIHTFVQQS